MMWNFLFYFLVFVLLAGGGVFAALLVRGFLDGDTTAGGLFGGRNDRRLEVVEQSNMDGRRKLVLIRRDNIEHLIMTGGPVDVVVETNIRTSKTSNIEPIANVVEARAPRTFGKVAAAGE